MQGFGSMCAHVCIYVYIQSVYIGVCTNIYIYMYIYVCVYTYVYIYIYMNILMSVYIYIYTCIPRVYIDTRYIRSLSV